MMLLATYDSDLNGVVLDGIDGRSVATWEWSNLAHPWPLTQIMEAMRWSPDLFAPSRENHIVNSTSVVNHVEYTRGRVEFTTFDAPTSNITTLRLAFIPDQILADDAPLAEIPGLARNGYEFDPLANGDCTLRIRHDSHTRVLITGDDPQVETNAIDLQHDNEWRALENGDSLGGALLVAGAPGATATFTFTGNQVRIIGFAQQQGGRADIYLDGEKQNTVLDCWSSSPQPRRVLYSRSGLDNTLHELRIVARGEANLLSGGTLITLDSVQHSAATGSTGFGSGGGPTGPQRMIFGYVEREDHIDTRGYPWRPATEWIVRSGYGTDSIAEALWTERRTMWIGKTDDPELYRYGIHGEEFETNITVGPGNYDVTLHFAATPLHWFLEQDPDGGTMQYIQSVAINGETVIDRMNVAWEAGGTFTALTRTFPNIQPRNGIIEIKCTGLDGREAVLQALEVIPTQQ